MYSHRCITDNHKNSASGIEEMNKSDVKYRLNEFLQSNADSDGDIATEEYGLSSSKSNISVNKQFDEKSEPVYHSHQCNFLISDND